MRFLAPRPALSSRGLRALVVGVAVAASVSACTLGSASPRGVAGSPGPESSTSVPAPTSSAVFQNFTVTISRIEQPPQATQSLVQAKVCVTSLPSSYVGKRIRVSWDPWTVVAGSRKTEPGYRGKVPAGLFRADGDYPVGSCVSGAIPFPVAGDLDSVRYDNSLGDEAVWDAGSLALKPAG